MMTLPKVSVLMPIYKTNPQYLCEAIDSILKQTFTDFEFLILDDCPDDTRENIVKSYQDSRIRYFKNDINLGISATRNKLIDLARGEYLAVFDHDDIALPERLEKEALFLDNNPQVGAVGAWMQYFQDKEGVKRFIEHPKLLDFYFYGNQIAQPALTIRKNVLDKYNLKYDEAYPPAEDYELWTRLARYTKIYNIQEVLLYYRWHGQNISQTQAQRQKKLAQQVQDNILDYACGDAKTRYFMERIYFDFSQSSNLTRKIFSIRNIRLNREKHKIITVFGFSFIWSKR